MSMPPLAGDRTTLIAEKLNERLNANPGRFSTVELFYGHGDSSEPEVCQPTSYMGRRYGSDATLSGLDIVLVKDGRVFMAVEVEESQARPKLILGDVFGAVLASGIRIRGRAYPVDDAVLLVGLVVKEGGKQALKYDRLERHLQKYVNALRSTDVACHIAKVRIITSPVDDLVRRIERLIALEVGKRTKTGKP